MLTLGSSELQSDNAQRISSGGAAHTHYHSPCQGHDPFHACFPHDCLLFDATERSRQHLFHQDILDLLRSNHVVEFCGSGAIRCGQWDVGGEADLSQLYADDGRRR